MRIAVFVKPIAIGESNQAYRFSINASEKVALAEASKIIKLRGGDVVVFSIGDKQFVPYLNELYGATEAYLITDPLFSNIDVFAKSEVLLAAIRKSKPFDVLMFGEFSQDTSDWILPYLIAEKLNLPHISRAIKAWSEDSRIVCECVYYGDLYVKEARMPLVVSMLDALAYNARPIRDFKPKEVKIWDANFLGIKAITNKTKTLSMKVLNQRKPKLIEYNSYDDLADKLCDLIINNLK
jgi:electron transfer flavoprotein beta subunit